MKIHLDTQEVAAIITNWGKEKYKTHNVSVDNLTKDGAIMFVTMAEDGFSNENIIAAQHKLTAAELNAMHQFNEAQDTINGPPLDNAGNTEFI